MCRRAAPGRGLRKRVDLGLRPVGAAALALGHAYAPRGGPVDCVALGNRSRAGAPESGREALAYACTWAWRGPIRPGQERLSPAGRPSPTPAHGRGAVPVVVPWVLAVIATRARERARRGTVRGAW